MSKAAQSPTRTDEIKTLQGPWFSIEDLEAHLPALLPKPFVCPICGDRILLESIDGASEVAPGKWVPDCFTYSCVTEPDIDHEDWEEWHRGHWSMPYVDWLPVEKRFENWLQMNIAAIRPELKKQKEKS